MPDKKVQPFIEFNITQKCNYLCDYCSQGALNKNKPHTLYNATDEVLDGFVDFVKKVGQDFEIQLIGGEPFCHPKFIETAGKIAQLGNKIIIFTNMSFPVSSFEKFINACGDNLKLIHGALHPAQEKDLDARIRNIVEISKLLKPPSKMEIVSVVTQENFKTLQYIENELSRNNVDFIYIRLIKQNGKISRYSQDVENYLKLKEHKYNLDMLNARKIDTKKVLCHAGSKLLHVWTDGTIVRCWSHQSKFHKFGNVAKPKSIKLLKNPSPCYSPTCFCQHPTARNAYFYSCLTPLYRCDYKALGENVLSAKNEYSNGKKYKVLTIAGIKMKFGQSPETHTTVGGGVINADFTPSCRILQAAA
jgi:MoaA/NifB/PqqE/SkfB family radical SAM enzyme